MPGVGQLYGPEQPPRLRRGQRVDDDDDVRLRRLHRAFHERQTLDARLPQHARLAGRDARQTRQRLGQLRAQMPRHDEIADGLGPDGVGRDLPVAEADDERLPARPQQLAQRPADRPRRCGKAPGLPPRQRVELGCDVGAARLAERLLALGVENAHERHAHAAAVGLAREHAGQPRLLAC